MTVNNNLDIEFKQKMASIENDMDDYNLDIATIDNDKNLSNSVKMYLKEIGSIPRLSKEDTKKYARVISCPEKVRLLKISYDSNIQIYSLNIVLLFYSLANSSIYNSIIDSFLNLLLKQIFMSQKQKKTLLNIKRFLIN